MDQPQRYGCHERAVRFHSLNLRPAIDQRLRRVSGIFQCRRGGDGFSLVRGRLRWEQLSDLAKAGSLERSRSHKTLGLENRTFLRSWARFVLGARYSAGISRTASWPALPHQAEHRTPRADHPVQRLEAAQSRHPVPRAQRTLRRQHAGRSRMFAATPSSARR
jgi:hypothetical protein